MMGFELSTTNQDTALVITVYSLVRIAVVKKAQFMSDVLGKWIENKNASVQIYSMSSSIVLHSVAKFVKRYKIKQKCVTKIKPQE